MSVRSEARDRRLQEAAEAGEDYGSSSVHYLASHYLTHSSLSTDVTNFDFGTSAVSASVSRSLHDYVCIFSDQPGMVTVPGMTITYSLSRLKQLSCKLK